MWHGTLQGNEDPGTWAFEEAIATGRSLLPSPQSKQQQPVLAWIRAWLHRWEVPPWSGGEPVTQERRSTRASRLGLRLPVNHCKITESLPILPKLYIETRFLWVFISAWNLLCRMKHTSCIPAFLLLSFLSVLLGSLQPGTVLFMGEDVLLPSITKREESDD